MIGASDPKTAQARITAATRRGVPAERRLSHMRTGKIHAYRRTVVKDSQPVFSSIPNGRIGRRPYCANRDAEPAGRYASEAGSCHAVRSAHSRAPAMMTSKTGSLMS